MNIAKRVWEYRKVTLSKEKKIVGDINNLECGCQVALQYLVA